MADIAPTPPLPPQQTYRPIAGLALAGFGLALASGFVFLLDAPWLVTILPLPALIISVMARYRIRRSEGTQAGYTLAGLGAALSTVVILVYLTVAMTQYWIIRSESAGFLERWLERMRDGKEGLAFLDTVPPDQRHVTFALTDIRKIRAHYPSPGNPDESMFDYFRRAQLSGALLRYKDQVEWKYVGMEECKSVLGSYIIKHRYWLKTPEASGHVFFAMRSDMTESSSGPRREWRIEIQGCTPATSPPAVYTARGEKLREVQREAGKALRNWLYLIATGDRAAAENLLSVSADQSVKADFGALYEALRRDARPTVPVRLMPKDSATLLLGDINEGKFWALEYEGAIDTNTREVEFRFRIESDDAEKGPDSWRISWVKFMGEHKKSLLEQKISGPGADGG